MPANLQELANFICSGKRVFQPGPSAPIHPLSCMQRLKINLHQHQWHFYILSFKILPSGNWSLKSYPRISSMDLCLLSLPSNIPMWRHCTMNARTGSKGLLDLERLCNLEPRDKQGQGHSSFIMLGPISTCLFPEQRAAGGAHWLLGRSNVPTFTSREGPLPVSLPATQRLHSGLQCCMPSEP